MRMVHDSNAPLLDWDLYCSSNPNCYKIHLKMLVGGIILYTLSLSKGTSSIKDRARLQSYVFYLHTLIQLPYLRDEMP